MIRKIVLRWIALVCFAALHGACQQQNIFVCAEDADCREDERSGTCEAIGVCSFPDPDCPSRRRYARLAGSLSGTCVPDVTDTGASSGTTHAHSSSDTSLSSSDAITDSSDGGNSSSESGSTPCQPVEVFAFPTAQGYGRNALGGRRGEVIHVTNLDDAGPGSLRAALEAQGPRIVVFDLSGTISLATPIALTEENSFVTIAGQTAPGDGISLRDSGLELRGGAHDVIIRHLKIRPGLALAPAPGPSPIEIRGIVLSGEGGTSVNNVIIDHVTVMWAPNDLIQIWDSVTNTTVQWSLLAEGISAAQHMGAWSKGLLMGGTDAGTSTVSIHHTLFANNSSYNPHVQKAMRVDVRNVFAANWACNNGVYFGRSCTAEGDMASGEFKLVASRFVRGIDSTCNDFAYLGGDATKVYVEDNWGPFCAAGCADEWVDFRFVELLYEICPGMYTAQPAPEEKFRAYEPFDVPPVDTVPTDQLLATLVERVGADRPKRDAEEQRVIDGVLDGTGRVGMNGEYPTLSSTPPPLDSDADGMPDAWEQLHGLTPTDPSDGVASASNGYTNVENYINELAGDPTCF